MKRADEIIANFRIVSGIYVVEDRVGGGSFGDVFIGRDTTSGIKYAIKFEKKCQYVYQTLPKEAKVLSIMEGCEGFAQLMSISTENNFNILVMNLLGPNLEKVFKYCDSIILMTRQILDEDCVDDGHQHVEQDRDIPLQEPDAP